MATAAANKSYESIEPRSEILSEKDADTIVVDLPEFKKEKLRVQLTSANAVRISGQRETDDKIYQFQKAFPLSSNIDANKITAKFEKSKLYVRLPKLITPEEKPNDNKAPIPQTPKPDQKPANEPPQPPQTSAPQPKTEDSSKPQQAASVKDEPTQKKDKNTAEKVDSGIDPARKEKYQGNGVDLAAKLKNSRRAFYVVLVGIAAVGIGLYVTNFIRSFRSSEISG